MQGIIQQNYQGIEALQIKSIEEGPLTPLSVMIRNKFVPVLPYDWQTESGALTEIRPIQLPIVIGYGFGGIVEQVGRLRHSSLIGQRVIGMQPNGSAQEVINNKIPPLLFKVPDQVTLADATTLVGGADAALHAIKVLQIQSTDTVLVNRCFWRGWDLFNSVTEVSWGHSDCLDQCRESGFCSSIRRR